MAEYYNVTTNLGDAEIANAIATNTKLNITHIAFGDGNGSVPAPNKARTSLVREVHRQAVTKYERHATNANWIVIETIIPSSIGGFWVREMGIIANGKLISHGSHAPFEKVADPSGVSEYRIRFTQNVTDGSVVEITLDESLIYASQAWVEENFIKRTEIVDNSTTDDATKPVSAKQVKKLQDNKLNTSDLKDASTGQKGIIQVASLEEAIAGIEELKAITPATLIALFSSGLNRFSIPNASEPRKPWIIQFGVATEYVQTNFPIAYPNACEVILATPKVNGGDNSGAVTTAYILSESKFQLTCGNSNGNVLYWVSIGK